MQKDGKYTDKSHALARTPLTQLKADTLHVWTILAEGYKSLKIWISKNMTY